jgi:hypothetical protein
MCDNVLHHTVEGTMEGIGKDIATSVGSGVILAVLGWLWITFSPLGKAFWENLGKVEGIRTLFVVAGLALVIGIAALISTLFKSPSPQPLQLPKGIVITSIQPCDTQSGWREYSDAAGRFLVTVGRNRDRRGVERTFKVGPGVGEEDGEYRHTLTIEEMPAHTHDEFRATGNGDGLYPKDTVMGPQSQPIRAPTQSAGGNKPHDIVPPYVALYLCIK